LLPTRWLKINFDLIKTLYLTFMIFYPAKQVNLKGITMKTKYFIAAMATVALASCKKELMPQDSSSAQEISAPTASTQTPGQALPVNAQPQQASVQPNMQPTAQPVTQAPVKVAKGMNPPHGQPGHRCDIAVGAPLNSPPAATNSAKAMPITATPQPGMAVAKEITQSVKTAPGMNPPHGQPGHRCDIAVGAPLNSPPAAIPATNATPALLSAPAETKQ
jgi:hypothetical protein